MVGAVSAQAEGLAFSPPLGSGSELVLFAVLVCAEGLCGILGVVLGLAVLLGAAAGIGWLRQGETELEGTAYRPCLRGVFRRRGGVSYAAPLIVSAGFFEDARTLASGR